MEYMMRLSEETIRKAIDTCIKKDGYRVGVACMDKKIGNEISRMMRDILLNVDCVENVKFICNRDRCEVYFNNNSIIKVINASINSCGTRFHSLLIDESVPIEIDAVKHRLQTQLSKYYER